MIESTPAGAFDALLVQRTGVILIVLDDRLRIARAGSAAAELAERPEGELPGMSLIAAFGSATLDAVARQASGSREPAHGEAQLGGPRGREFAVDAVPVDPGGLVLALHDVTALRRSERVRRDFVANISHELRTPLASITLLAETLASGAVEDSATITDFATQVAREAGHLARLVDDLLDLSMIESGALQLSIAPLPPDVVVDDLLARIGPVATKRDVQVKRQPEPANTDARALGDRARLGQALLNLAHNAVKYSHPGGEVRIGWEASDAAVRFLVSDDGVGVAPPHQSRIFERFYKADRARTRGDEREDEALGAGAGLGLAIVRHIAEAHRGSAGFTPMDPNGSTFWVEVPRARLARSPD